MAEIDVQQKSNSWIWWLIGLIILALIAWAVFGGDEENRVEVTPVPVQAPANPANQ